MVFLKPAKLRPKYLDLLFKALQTIPPRSVEAKKVISSLGLFVQELI